MFIILKCPQRQIPLFKLFWLQGVEQVFLVGVGGAVPHYTDFSRHVRLGDVVMSAPPSDDQRYNFDFQRLVLECESRHFWVSHLLKFFRFIYQYCENVTERPLGSNKGSTSSSEIQFETKSWCPVDLCLQDIASSLVTRVRIL